MTFVKVEEKRGDYLLVYYIDRQKRKQGELYCYKTEGKEPSNETLLYVEVYKDGEFLYKHWKKLTGEFNRDSDTVKV
jgi:hypothetical protein